MLCQIFVGAHFQSFTFQGCKITFAGPQKMWTVTLKTAKFLLNTGGDVFFDF